MARSTGSAAKNPRDGRIEDIDVSDEMRGSFLEYAYSVIYSRALPDARDGMKPVQRRILFQMSEMGLRPERGHVKSARVVGDVMGKLHPHGEGAIYDALVRMAQDFTLRLPMVDGHGNFGSPDDGPAASRYTECRMAPAAVAMTASLDEDVVDFVPNYDGRELEPTVLPAAVPALLVNGTTGIAVGMATNCPPHNLGEVIGAARHLIDHPKASLDDLMRFVPGPDLPSGGKIVGLDGIREAYESGRGSFKMRATTRIEQVSPRRRGIVVTELPYGVGVERVMEKIKELHNSKKLIGIAGLTDLTDGDHGLHLVIEVKNGVNAEALLSELYRLTPLEESFNVNAVALVDGAPETLGLKRSLEVFLEHRFDVVRRRSEFRRAKAQDRLHLVDGLLVAILDIDEVIQLIRSSDDAAEAKQRLISVFDLTEIQAQYILDMPLRRLTKFSRIELESERDELQRTIERLTEILDDEATLRQVVSDELAEVSAAHATPRRTVLLASSGEPTVARAGAADLEVADDPCWALLSGTGLLARTNARDELPDDGPRTSHDVMTSVVPATARGDVAVVTSAGRVHRLSVIDLPAVPVTAGPVSAAGGAPLGEFVSLDGDESVVALMPLPRLDGGASADEAASTDSEDGGADDAGAVSGVLALGTRNGVVKRVAVERLRNKDVWDVIGLKDGDAVVGAAMCTDADELAFVTSDAQLLHFPAGAVRPQGRSAGGMAGIRLGSRASVVWFGAVASEDLTGESGVLVTMAGAQGQLPGTFTGAVKVTELRTYPAKGRGTAGVRCMRLGKGQDAVLMAWAGRGPARASGSGGVDVDLPRADERRDGSGTPVAAPIACVGGAAYVVV